MAFAGGPPNVSQENSSEYSKQHLGWNDSFNVDARLPDHCPANERVYPAIRLQSGFSASFVIPVLGGGVACIGHHHRVGQRVAIRVRTRKVEAKGLVKAREIRQRFK